MVAYLKSTDGISAYRVESTNHFELEGYIVSFETWANHGAAERTIYETTNVALDILMDSIRITRDEYLKLLKTL